MVPLKLRQLAVFVEIYQRQKIATAAERLNLTQSAASIALRQLELAVGASLFDRSTRSMRPTQAALDLFPIAERMLQDAQLAQKIFRRDTLGGTRLTVASTPTLAQTVMPRLLQAFAERHPEVPVDLLDVAPSRFVMAISLGHADLGIGYLGHEEPDLRQHRLLTDHLCLVAKAGSSVLQGEPPTWHALQHVPLALIQPGYGIRAIIDDAALKAGISLQVSHEVSHLTTALALTQAGLTHTIAPAQFARHDHFPGLEARRIRGPVVRRDISAVFAGNRAPSAAALQFLSLCRASLKDAAAAPPPAGAPEPPSRPASRPDAG